MVGREGVEPSWSNDREILSLIPMPVRIPAHYINQIALHLVVFIHDIFEKRTTLAGESMSLIIQTKVVRSFSINILYFFDNVNCFIGTV